MGFYGNITNTNKTQFTFDKTYPNRYEMESCLSTDEIYLGRYVLIEYDINTRDTYQQCYAKEFTENMQLYSSVNCEENTLIKWSKNPDGKNAVGTGDIVYVVEDLNNTNSKLLFYKCINDINTLDPAEGESIIAEFKHITSSDSPYTSNYNIDMDEYGAGRGYDSTVWQKVYTQGAEKYVMIAELNTVVPTFDLAADAPTMMPITPHFDTDSTNVYYKLHWQPQWGLRVAEAENENKSDCATTWKSVTYDPATDKITETVNTNVSAAIYFNKAGFDPKTKNVDNSENYITLLPTGMSGNEYNTHDGTGIKKETEDIQEMRINLPAIGNMMSDAWDIVHGPNRDDSPTNSLQGRLNFFTKEIKADEIPVHHKDGYLVGAHMTDDDWIYTKIDAENKTITVNHSFTEGSHETAESNVNDNGDTIELYTPEVDGKGHITGETITTVTLPYGFKNITTGNSDEAGKVEEKAESIIAKNTQDALSIVSGNKWIKTASDNSNNTLTIGHEVHDIEIPDDNEFSDLKDTGVFVLQDLSFDEAGHIVKRQSHEYKLPYGINKISVINSQESDDGESNDSDTSAVSHNHELKISAQNKWITLSADENGISFGHASADSNENTIAGDSEAISPSFGGKFTVPYIKYDKMGHIESSGVREVTMPKNYVGNLLLDGYESVNTDDQNFVQSTDSINTGIYKIDVKLNNHKSKISWLETQNANLIQEISNLQRKLTNESIEQWNSAEENVQSDWNQTDSSADDYIKNKPTNLVKTNDEFIYTPEEKDEAGEIVSEAIKYTNEGLFTKVRELAAYISTLENRISELEEFHTEEAL